MRSEVEAESTARQMTELAARDLKKQSATTNQLPESADLLNQLKRERKKSSTTLADIEIILELIELKPL